MVRSQRSQALKDEAASSVSPAGGASGSGSFGNGPQGYSKPVGFVAASSSREVERTDEEEEQERRLRKRRDHADSLREVSLSPLLSAQHCIPELTSFLSPQRERRVDQRERQRIQILNREADGERQRKQEESKEFYIMRDTLSSWDDDEMAEKGRDLWFTDRYVFSSRC